MKALREILLLLRAAQTRASIDMYQRAIERERAGLDKAIQAHDRACAALIIYELEHHTSPETPAFLRKGKQ